MSNKQHPRFDRPIPFDVGPLYSADDKIAPPKMWVDKWEDYKYERISSLSCSLAKEIENIVRTCLDRYFGRTDWTLDELEGRCFRVVPADKSSETCYIDNTALVVFYPADFVVENNTVRITRKYKILIDSEKEDGQQSR